MRRPKLLVAISLAATVAFACESGPTGLESNGDLDASFGTLATTELLASESGDLFEVRLFTLPDGGLPSGAHAVNARGQVAGWIRQAGVYGAVVWDRGQVRYLEPLEEGRLAVPDDINNAGVVVGLAQKLTDTEWRGTTVVNHAVRWVDGRVELLPSGWPEFQGGEAYTVDNSGFIGGSTAVYPWVGTVPAVFDDGQVSFLRHPDGRSCSEFTWIEYPHDDDPGTVEPVCGFGAVEALNSRGEMAGTVDIRGPQGTLMAALLWSDADSPPRVLAENTYWGVDINDRGQVALTIVEESARKVALWDSGELTIAYESDWPLQVFAAAIGPTGEIAGRAYSYDPVAAPPSPFLWREDFGTLLLPLGGYSRIWIEDLSVTAGAGGGYLIIGVGYTASGDADAVVFQVKPSR